MLFQIGLTIQCSYDGNIFVFFQVIRRFARHFQTREPMPEDMLHRLCASKYLFGASEMQLQVYYY